MNQLEARARPFLERMIAGETVEVSHDEREIIARWIALKVIVAEHGNPRLALTPRSDRETFMNAGVIPPYFRIYLMRHGVSRKTGYFRLANLLAKVGSKPVKPLNGMHRNVQQVTFFLGRALVHVNAARVDDWQIEDGVRFPLVHDEMRLWPIADDRKLWPLGPAFSENDVRRLSTSLRMLTNHPKAVWIE